MDEKTRNSPLDLTMDKTLQELSKSVVDMKANLEILHKSVLYDGRMLRNLQAQMLNISSTMEVSNSTLLDKIDQLLQKNNASSRRPVQNRSVGVFTTSSIHNTVPTFVLYSDSTKTSMSQTFNKSVIGTGSESASIPSNFINTGVTDFKRNSTNGAQSSETYTIPPCEPTAVTEENALYTSGKTQYITAAGEQPTMVSVDTHPVDKAVRDILKPRKITTPPKSATTNRIASASQTLYARRSAVVPAYFAATLIPYQEFRKVSNLPAAQPVRDTMPKVRPTSFAYSEPGGSSMFMSTLDRFNAGTTNQKLDNSNQSNFIARYRTSSQILEVPGTEAFESKSICEMDAHKPTRLKSASAPKNVLSMITVPASHDSSSNYVASSVSQSTICYTIFTAAATGNVEALLHILETDPDADVNLRDPNGNTALHLAALGGHESVAMLLMGAGALVNTAGRRHRTPLHCAAARGHWGVVRRLLASGTNADADFDAKTDDSADTKTPTKAENHPHLLVMSQEDKDGQTAIMLAAAGGHWRTVEMLLRAGSPVNGRNRNGETVLELATKAQQWPVVRAISIRRRQPRRKEESKTGPLLMAVEKGDAGAVRDMLLLVDFTNEELEEAFALVKDASVVRTFLQQVRRVVRGNAGLEVLWRAARFGDAELLQAMLEAGVDVNARNRFLNTALHYAAYNGHAECVKLLLQRGALKNARGNRGRTPLYDASEQGKEDCVRLLLAAGAYVTLRNDDGKTPLNAAKTEGMRAMLAKYIDCPV